jgi:hypothetical protein
MDGARLSVAGGGPFKDCEFLGDLVANPETGLRVICNGLLMGLSDFARLGGGPLAIAQAGLSASDPSGPRQDRSALARVVVLHAAQDPSQASQPYPVFEAAMRKGAEEDAAAESTGAGAGAAPGGGAAEAGAELVSCLQALLGAELFRRDLPPVLTGRVSSLLPY